MIDFVKISSKEQIQKLATFAKKIWMEYFTFIISEEQIEYMTDKFQSAQAIKNQISKDNYTYYFINFDNVICGYIGLQLQKDALFISKLYLDKNYRGKGISSTAFDFITDFAKKHSLNRIWLTCNKYNTNSIEIYKHKGFKIFESKVTDIGHGFVMDDYFFEKYI